MIEELHQIYCDETRLAVTCTLHRISTWQYWQRRGWNSKDLRDVCRYMRKQVDQGRRTIGALSFHLLIADVEFFEERLAEVRSFERKPKYNPGKAAVLKASGRPAEPPQAPAKQAGEIARGLNIAERLRQFKNKL